MKKTKFDSIYLYRKSTRVAIKIITSSIKDENGYSWYNYNYFFNLTRLLSNLLLNNYTNVKVKDWIFFLTPKKAKDYHLEANLEVYYISTFNELKKLLEDLNRKNKDYVKFKSLNQKLQYYQNILNFISSFKFHKEPLFTHNSISQTKSPINRRIRYCKERIPNGYKPEAFESFIERIYKQIIEKLTEFFFESVSNELSAECGECLFSS